MALKLSVWLLPTAQDEPQLRALIARFAKALGSPVFPPHVTMGSDPPVTILAAVGRPEELRSSLSLDELAFGDDYFHGCYLTARNDTAARELQERCAATLGAKVRHDYPPHLSLAYGVLDEAQRTTARALLPSLPLHVSFDRLELWTTEGPVSAWHKVT